jgi:UDP-2,3-diacylglucosamine pyrophosphatase LpxH
MVAEKSPPAVRRVRTLFVSDVHLGCRYAQPEQFLAYLNELCPDQVFLVGDFLDGWKLKQKWQWDSVCTAIVDRLLELARNGTRIYYTPGNHDAFLRLAEVGRLIENTGLKVKLQEEFVFRTQDGARFLVLHGDQFDVIERRWQWFSKALMVLYTPLLFVSWQASRALGAKSPASPKAYAVSGFLKSKAKDIVRRISRTDAQLRDRARSRDCQGVIYGHFHQPGVDRADAMTSINTGDWVEHCTALVERYDGVLWLESWFDDAPPERVYVPANRWEVAAGDRSSDHDPIASFVG